MPAYSVLGDAVEFLQAGHRRLDLAQAGPAQVRVAFLVGLIGELDGVAAFHDQAPHLLRHLDDLEDADPALVAVDAALAADRLVDGDALGDLVLGEALFEQCLARQFVLRGSAGTAGVPGAAP
jgi:hypothetical protein